MIGNIIVILIFYACLIGLYWLYKREKTDISSCPHDPDCVHRGDRETMESKPCAGYILLVLDTWDALLKQDPSFAGADTGPEVFKMLMDFEPKFDVGGIYSLDHRYQWALKNYPKVMTEDEEKGEQTWERNNCISVLKSKTKFKTNWLYFGDGF